MWENIRSLKIAGRKADLWRKRHPEGGRWVYDVTFRRNGSLVDPSGSAGLLYIKDAIAEARRSAQYSAKYENPSACKRVSRGVTLRNMALVTIRKNRDGSIAVSGRKMASRSKKR